MFEVTQKSKIVSLTPKKAEKLMEINQYPGQRIVRNAHIRRLAEHIKDGSFLLGDIAVAKNGDGSQFLANGQHQCGAVILAQKPIDVGWTEYYCPTSDDAVRLFSLFDNNKSRSFADTVNVQITAAGLPWRRKSATTFASALNRTIIEDGKISFSERLVGGDKYERANVILNHIKVGNFIDELVNDKRSSMLKKVPVLQLMIATFYKNEEDCFQFWESIKAGVFQFQDDPRLHYRDFLIEAVVGNSIAGHRYNPREIISRGVVTWNNFRKGNRRKHLASYRPGKPIPKLI